MTKIPDRPEDIFEPLTRDYLDVYGNDLVSLMLYGSAAGGAYVKGASDINILVVLTEAGISKLDACLPIVKNWRKSNVAVPLLMTKEFIASSLDAYPIEFFNMRNNSELIYGENVLEPLIFKDEDLRLQIERELKGKILWLREGYLESGGSSRRVRDLIGKSVTAFIAIFNALLFLKTGEAPRDKRETIKRMAEACELDAGVFESCFAIREGDRTSGAGDIFKKYLAETRKIADSVDKL
jgi:hypothetical protein